MKNFSLTLLFIGSLATAASAQVGFEMGLNMANLAIKAGGTSIPTTFKPGLGLGFIGDLAIAPNFYFEPGLFYEMAGCKITTPKGKYNINTVQVPLNIEFKSGDKCSARFFIGVGPYIAYNTSASTSFDDNSGSSVGGTLKIGSDKTDDLKGLDIGLGANIGYQLKKRFYLRAHYQVGFLDLNPVADDKNTTKPSAFGVTLGYLFGKCDPYRSAPGFGRSKSNHWRGMSKAKYSRKVKYPRQ